MRNPIPLVLFLSVTLLVGGSSLLATACSSTSSDASSDADASAGDGSPAPSADGSRDATSRGDSSPTPGAGPDEACGKEATRTACGLCCNTNHTAGYRALVVALLSCACADGGAGDGGAGPCFAECGTNACATPPSMATAACNTCLGGSIGTGRSCDENVSDKCVADPECLAQQTCVAENCISKP